MEINSYKTIKSPASATYTEKRSKFIAYIESIETVEESKEILDKLRKEYYDARHICWAYMLGPERDNFRSNDDGEPSGTAGKPILGQINSYNITNVFIAVIRYFGGIKLGTSGLITSYREAASLAIQEAEIIEKTIDLRLSFTFDYLSMNDVMKIVKDLEPTIIHQDFNLNCSMTLEIPKAKFKELDERIRKVDKLKINEEEE